jgi:asparagine synthetase B (glutamine-hydrolysing)
VGVRALYIGVSRHDGQFGSEYSDLTCVSLNSDHYALCIASEMKSIHSICDTVVQFPAGCYMEYIGEDGGNAAFHSYYDPVATATAVAGDDGLDSTLKQLHVNYSYPMMVIDAGIDDATAEKEICANIRELFTRAVVKRLMSERPVGCLLSGGLDSSLVTAIVARELKRTSPDTVLNTYSIGLDGSVDLIWARRVAEHLGTCHHEVTVTEQDFLDAIYETIYQTESYCTTTIRASVGNCFVLVA